MEKKSPSYLALVWRKGRDDANAYFKKDPLSIVGRIITGIAFAVASPTIMYWTGQLNAMPNFPLIFIIAAISGIVGMYSWYWIVRISHTVAAPAKLYREQEIEVAEYNNQIKELRETWEDGDTVPANLVIVDFNDSQTYSKKVGIMFYNPIPKKKVTNLIVTLKVT